MKDSKNLRLMLFCMSVLMYMACSPTEEDPIIETPQDPLAALNLPDEYFNYAHIELPAHYYVNAFPPQTPFQNAATAYDNTPIDNAITDEGATLGRVLFYDEKLSANGTVSCASCHQQSHGFSDPEILSIGFDGGLTGRHSMGLSNARFYTSGKFFWDERAETLEDQVLMPFQDEVEMGLTLDQLESIVRAQDYYPPLFESAFGDTTVTSELISKALAQFVRSIVNTSSKYDMARSNAPNPIVDFADFTPEENLGKALFFMPQMLTNGNTAACAGCHVSEAFVGPVPPGPGGTSTATNNGMVVDMDDDQGVFHTTGNMNDRGKFKAPSLVNIGARPPYMHDGSLATLEEVVEHYSSGIQNHRNLSPPLRGPGGQAGHFIFTDEEKSALVAFMHTLSDFELMSDEKYSNPFK